MYCLYPYGSWVYGTADEHSDMDFILVTDSVKEAEKQYILPKFDITFWSFEEYQRRLDDHDPSAIECFFLPKDRILNQRLSWSRPRFELNLSKLRKSFSAKASNSWVKAKKKIDVEGELRLGQKSLFHSLRLLGFGIQIAKFGKLLHYDEENSIWNDIMKQGFTSWQPYKEYWQGYYKSLHSEFRKIAPLGEKK